MKYLALGDSISIDDYTQQVGGGAVSQFARLIQTDGVQDLTSDGCTTIGVLAALKTVTLVPNIITLTVCGNDLLQVMLEQAEVQYIPKSILLEHAAQVPLENLALIAQRLTDYQCPVIINTIYDPTDGDDDALVDQMGVPAEWRLVFNQINDGIKTLAEQHGFILSDLVSLFHGHGIASSEPWLVMQIEPNLAGTTAIAKHWHALFQRGSDKVSRSK